jgi:hypothetical protein
MTHEGPHNSPHAASHRRNHLSFTYLFFPISRMRILHVRPARGVTGIVAPFSSTKEFPPSTLCTGVHIRTAPTGATLDSTLAAYNFPRWQGSAPSDTTKEKTKPARLETGARRDGLAIRAYKVRPHHVLQESIAARTPILEERVVSRIKTGLSYSY